VLNHRSLMSFFVIGLLLASTTERNNASAFVEPAGPALKPPETLDQLRGHQTPPDHILQQNSFRNREIGMEWYQSRGLVPNRQSPWQGDPLFPEELQAYNDSISGLVGGDTVDPSSRGAHSHSITRSFPGTYTMDLTTATSLRPRSIRMRNTGPVSIVHPWVVANGVGDWFSAQSITREAIDGETNMEAAALRLWEFIRKNRYHFPPVTEDIEVHSPVRFFNVYGYGFCDDAANNMECMAKLAGFPGARVWGLGGHVVAELLYHGSWHMFDPDMEVFAPLKPSNTGQASVAQIAADPDLITRVGAGFAADLFATTFNNSNYQNWWDRHATMAMILRPGEMLERRFDQWGKYISPTFPEWGAPPVFGNGVHEWAPDLAQIDPRPHFSKHSNLQWSSVPPHLTPEDASSTMSLETVLQGPFPFANAHVKFRVTLDEGDTLIIAARRSGDNQTSEIERIQGPFDDVIFSSLEDLIAPLKRRPTYQLIVSLTLIPDPLKVKKAPLRHKGIHHFSVQGTIQCSPLALPKLLPLRENSIEVRFLPNSNARLEVEFDWDDEQSLEPTRSSLVLPMDDLGFSAVEAVAPPDGANLVSLQPSLVWQGGLHPNQEVWRAVRVTWDQAGRFPISPVLLPRRAMGQNFEIPEGWLFHDRDYFWQIREGSPREERSTTFRFRTVPFGVLPATISEWRAYQDDNGG
jgi:hypothetical protein